MYSVQFSAEQCAYPTLLLQIHAVVFSSAALQVVGISSADSTAWPWGLSGAPITELRGHAERVFSSAFGCAAGAADAAAAQKTSPFTFV